MSFHGFWFKVMQGLYIKDFYHHLCSNKNGNIDNYLPCLHCWWWHALLLMTMYLRWKPTYQQWLNNFFPFSLRPLTLAFCILQKVLRMKNEWIFDPFAIKMKFHGGYIALAKKKLQLRVHLHLLFFSHGESCRANQNLDWTRERNRSKGFTWSHLCPARNRDVIGNNSFLPPVKNSSFRRKKKSAIVVH